MVSNVYVYNNIGKLVYSTKINDFATIQTSGWTNGLYFVRVGGATKKLVIAY